MQQTNPSRTLCDARGFTLVEFMIAALITTAVLGGTVVLATQLQQGYSTQLDDVLVEQEARFALDWIARILRSAGSNPYSVSTSPCPTVGTPFQAIRIDPDGDGMDDDIRIQADISPPNGILGGDVAGTCTEEGEDVTIAHDADALTITLEDNNTDDAPQAMTEPIIPELEFTYLNSARNVTTDPDLIAYVQVQVTGRSKTYNTILGEYPETTLTTEVHVRTR
ncbi:MAG TPA: prepilin-type N-terminal cleavage/methylation domain-containing protein [Vicinamibacterales bacterium]